MFGVCESGKKWQSDRFFERHLVERGAEIRSPMQVRTPEAFEDEVDEGLRGDMRRCRVDGVETGDLDRDVGKFCQGQHRPKGARSLR